MSVPLKPQGWWWAADATTAVRRLWVRPVPRHPRSTASRPGPARMHLHRALHHACSSHRHHACISTAYPPRLHLSLPPRLHLSPPPHMHLPSPLRMHLSPRMHLHAPPPRVHLSRSPHACISHRHYSCISRAPHACNSLRHHACNSPRRHTCISMHRHHACNSHRVTCVIGTPKQTRACGRRTRTRTDDAALRARQRHGRTSTHVRAAGIGRRRNEVHGASRRRGDTDDVRWAGVRRASWRWRRGTRGGRADALAEDARCPARQGGAGRRGWYAQRQPKADGRSIAPRANTSRHLSAGLCRTSPT